VPDNAIVGGVPAKIIKYIDRSGSKASGPLDGAEPVSGH
jgi:acetyltransferase-like isoleucine patch superfamily enzyme